jgi:hypothetical protein
MTAVIMNVGRYLGIGDKEVAVTFSAGSTPKIQVEYVKVGEVGDATR